MYVNEHQMYFPHECCNYRSMNCLPFRTTWGHHRFYLGSCYSIFSSLHSLCWPLLVVFLLSIKLSVFRYLICYSSKTVHFMFIWITHAWSKLVCTNVITCLFQTNTLCSMLFVRFRQVSLYGNCYKKSVIAVSTL